mmetsp:Transcript_99672/g.172978  ORF Transcript_99672/g.172978 Transcript_99672/m.172978 type:complete len:276 (+) Transcript_99672:591-1418(+)
MLQRLSAVRVPERKYRQQTTSKSPAALEMRQASLRLLPMRIFPQAARQLCRTRRSSKLGSVISRRCVPSWQRSGGPSRRCMSSARPARSSASFARSVGRRRRLKNSDRIRILGLRLTAVRRNHQGQQAVQINGYQKVAKPWIPSQQALEVLAASRHSRKTVQVCSPCKVDIRLQMPSRIPIFLAWSQHTAHSLGRATPPKEVTAAILVQHKANMQGSAKRDTATAAWQLAMDRQKRKIWNLCHRKQHQVLWEIGHLWWRKQRREAQRLHSMPPAA